MATRSTLAILVFLAACFTFVAGCSQTDQKPADDKEKAGDVGDDYNPHDVPITEEQKADLRNQTAKFADAVATINQLRNEVQQETAAGIPENPFQAHQALDKADLVLKWLPEIARDSGVAKEDWEAVNTSANALRTLFEKVHQNIDNKQNPDFAAVAEQMDQKLADLEKITAAPTTEQ